MCPGVGAMLIPRSEESHGDAIDDRSLRDEPADAVANRRPGGGRAPADQSSERTMSAITVTSRAPTATPISAALTGSSRA